MGFNKDKAKEFCPFGEYAGETVQKMEERLAAMETKFKAVMDATASDSGKSLLIDANGKVKLST